MSALKSLKSVANNKVPAIDDKQLNVQLLSASGAASSCKSQQHFHSNLASFFVQTKIISFITDRRNFVAGIVLMSLVYLLLTSLQTMLLFPNDTLLQQVLKSCHSLPAAESCISVRQLAVGVSSSTLNIYDCTSVTDLVIPAVNANLFSAFFQSSLKVAFPPIATYILLQLTKYSFSYLKAGSLVPVPATDYMSTLFLAIWVLMLGTMTYLWSPLVHSTCYRVPNADDTTSFYQSLFGIATSLGCCAVFGYTLFHILSASRALDREYDKVLVNTICEAPFFRENYLHSYELVLD